MSWPETDASGVTRVYGSPRTGDPQFDSERLILKEIYPANPRDYEFPEPAIGSRWSWQSPEVPEYHGEIEVLGNDGRAVNTTFPPGLPLQLIECKIPMKFASRAAFYDQCSPLE